EGRNLSLVGTDSQRILAVAQAWTRSGNPIEALRWAQDRVDRESYLRLCREVLGTLRKDRRALQDVLLRRPNFLAQIEDASGERAVSEAQLLATVTGFHTSDFIVAYGAFPYLIGRFS